MRVIDVGRELVVVAYLSHNNISRILCRFPPSFFFALFGTLEIKEVTDNLGSKDVKIFSVTELFHEFVHLGALTVFICN